MGRGPVTAAPQESVQRALYREPIVAAALISAAVALLVTGLLQFWLAKRLLRHKLETEYRYEQRRKIKEVTGRYRGRVVQAAEGWDRRMEELYAYPGRRWLAVGGEYGAPDNYTLHYYAKTTVYRFLDICTHIRRYELEAVVLDDRTAENEDLHFAHCLRALFRTLTDPRLFRDLDYDGAEGMDHLRIDILRLVCDACWTKDGFLSLDEFQRRLDDDPKLRHILDFFDGLSRGEERFRWDRLVAFHLVILAALRQLGGTPTDLISDERFDATAVQFRHAQTFETLASWAPGMHFPAAAALPHALLRARSPGMRPRRSSESGPAAPVRPPTSGVAAPPRMNP